MKIAPAFAIVTKFMLGTKWSEITGYLTFKGSVEQIILSKGSTSLRALYSLSSVSTHYYDSSLLLETGSLGMSIYIDLV